jgi:hypothetical protein
MKKITIGLIVTTLVLSASCSRYPHSKYVSPYNSDYVPIAAKYLNDHPVGATSSRWSPAIVIASSFGRGHYKHDWNGVLVFKNGHIKQTYVTPDDSVQIYNSVSVGDYIMVKFSSEHEVYYAEKDLVIVAKHAIEIEK